MLRAASTSDVFHAIADPHRRDLLVYLAPRERPVNQMAAALRLRQPSVSKHLKVLRQAGLVHARRQGRQVLYRTDAGAIRPIHEWTQAFETFWESQLSRIKAAAEAKTDSPPRGGAPE